MLKQFAFENNKTEVNSIEVIEITDEYKKRGDLELQGTNQRTNSELNDERIQTSDQFSEKEKVKLKIMLEKYSNVFSDKPGIIRDYEHEIVLKDTTPFYFKSYPVPLIYRTEVKRQIQEMIDWGIIDKQRTEYVSPLVVVKKKCGSPRICIDARYLNARMEKDHVIPPNAHELMYKFKPGQYMSILDLSSSYWQIKMAEKVENILDFHTKGKLMFFVGYHLV